MGRPSHIDNPTLIAAARAVFLERGPAATTADVAARAGVSEGTLFKRFKSKEALFRQALQPTQEIPNVIERLASMAGQGDLRENLVQICVELIRVFEQTMPLMILGYGHGLEAEQQEVQQPAPIRARLQLAAFLEAEIRAGRMRRVEPEVAAAMLLGCLMNYLFTYILMPNKALLPMPAEVYVRSMVQTFWTGFAPE
jgi:AcrR family transcriptional regulator